MNVRDAFYEILRTHGITTIVGNPGSNELPLLSHRQAFAGEPARRGGHRQRDGEPGQHPVRARAGGHHLRPAGTGPAFTEEAIMDAVNAAKTDSTVFAHEWTSTLVSP
jgi:hypothetical protein